MSDVGRQPINWAEVLKSQVPAPVLCPYDQHCMHGNYNALGQVVGAWCCDCGYRTDMPASASRKCFNHDWRTYVGFSETYEFCAVCDSKKFPDGRVQEAPKA